MPHRTDAHVHLDSGFRWPPPGLERLQGDLWRIAASASLAGALMVLPLLFVAAREQPFATLGPFADAWWVMLVLPTIGLGFAFDALLRASRALRRAAQAAERGYDWGTLAYVLADTRRDMGFLLQGVRYFSVMEGKERAAVAALRVFAAASLVLGGLWLSVTLAIGLLLGARGVVAPSTLWIVTLVPASAFYLFGAVAGLIVDTRVRRARRSWHGRPWAADLVEEDIREWQQGLPLRSRPGPSYVRLARGAAVAMGAFAAVVALPVVTLLPASAIGPVLTLVAVPRFEAMQRRAATAEAYRPWRVEVDPTITAGEAGRLLQNLMYVGSERPVPAGEREPPLRIEGAWVPESPAGENPLGSPAHLWPAELFGRLADGATAEMRAYLAELAAHPAHADFSRLARARSLDAAGARWMDPLPQGTTLASLPIPRYGELRNGVYAHVAAAANEWVRGRPARAEEMLREIVSVGFLLGDQGPTLIDNLIGFFMIQGGAEALQGFYRATGRTDDLQEMERLETATDRAAERIHVPEYSSVEAFVRSLPSLVTDSTAVRGLRWEQFTLVTTLTPCLNLHRIVFGPDEEYRAFIERAHASLVHSPSEEGLFQLARAGYLGASPTVGASLLGRLLSVSMYGGEAACGQVVRRLETIRSLF